MEENIHTKEECVNARPKELNATIVEGSTTIAKYCMSKPRQENATGTRPADRKLTRSSGQHRLRDDSESDEYVFTLSLHSTEKNRNHHPMFKVRVNDTWLDLLADSGSSINLLNSKSFHKLKPRPTLEPTNAKIYPYKSDDTLPILGKFKARVETTHTQTIEATLCDRRNRTDGSILSWRTSKPWSSLELLDHSSPQPLTTESMVSES